MTFIVTSAKTISDTAVSAPTKAASMVVELQERFQERFEEFLDNRVDQIGEKIKGQIIDPFMPNILQTLLDDAVDNLLPDAKRVLRDKANDYINVRYQRIDGNEHAELRRQGSNGAIDEEINEALYQWRFRRGRRDSMLNDHNHNQLHIQTGMDGKVRKRKGNGKKKRKLLKTEKIKQLNQNESDHANPQSDGNNEYQHSNDESKLVRSQTIEDIENERIGFEMLSDLELDNDSLNDDNDGDDGDDEEEEEENNDEGENKHSDDAHNVEHAALVPTPRGQNMKVLFTNYEIPHSFDAERIRFEAFIEKWIIRFYYMRYWIKNPRKAYKRFRAFVIYNSSPFDQSIWECLWNPWWILFTAIGFLPYGIGMGWWLLMFIMHDKRDEYQVSQFIVGFQTSKFLSQGCFSMMFGAFLYYSCATSPSAKYINNCVENGPRIHRMSDAFFFLVQILLIWACFFIIKSTESCKKVENPIDKYMLEDAEKHEIKLKEKFGERIPGGRLIYLFWWDTFTIALLLLLAIVSYFILHQERWQLETTLYWLRTVYGLLSLPFVVFKLPIIRNILIPIKATGYNRDGETVLCVKKQITDALVSHN